MTIPAHTQVWPAERHHREVQPESDFGPTCPEIITCKESVVPTS